MTPRLAATLSFLLFLLLAGCAPVRHYEAALVLQDIAADRGASRLKQATAVPLRKSIVYTVDGRERHGACIMTCRARRASSLPAGSNMTANGSA